MRHLYKTFISATIAVLTLVGCTSDSDNPDSPVSKDYPVFSASISELLSRVSDNQWEAGDEIGISGSGHVNVCYNTITGNGLFAVKAPGEPIYFQSDDAVTFAAYHPWKALAGTSTAISVNTRNQSLLKSFDFLWAQASGRKSQPAVSFNFVHKMTKLSFIIKPGADVSYDELKRADLSFRGIRHDGTFDINSGTTSVSGSSESWSFTDFVRLDDTQRALTVSMIFLPQIFNGPLEFIAALTAADGASLRLIAEIDFTAANSNRDGAAAKNEWVSGRQYNLSLTLHKTGMSVNECVINPWNDYKGDEINVD